MSVVCLLKQRLNLIFSPIILKLSADSSASFIRLTEGTVVKISRKLAVANSGDVKRYAVM